MKIIEFLNDFNEDLIKIKNFISNLWEHKNLLKNYNNNDYALDLFLNDIKKLENNINLSKEALKYFENHSDKINLLSNFIPNNDLELSEILDISKNYVTKIKEIRNPIFWYIWKLDKINEVNRVYKKKFNNLNLNKPQRNRFNFRYY